MFFVVLAADKVESESELVDFSNDGFSNGGFWLLAVELLNRRRASESVERVLIGVTHEREDKAVLDKSPPRSFRSLSKERVNTGAGLAVPLRSPLLKCGALAEDRTKSSPNVTCFGVEAFEEPTIF